MDNVISVLHSKENVLEFDLTMEGIELKDLEVKLMVEAKDMQLGFVASKKDGDTWKVKIPKLPFLEQSAYPCYIEVHADGYFFEPFKGTLNITKSAEIYSSDPKNVTLGPKEEEEKKPAPKKKAAAKKKATPKKEEPKKEDKKPEEKVAPPKSKDDKKKEELKEQAVKDILNIPEKATTKRTKLDFSIEDLAHKLIAEKTGSPVPQKPKADPQAPKTKDEMSFDEAARQIMESHKFDKEEIDQKVEEMKEAVEKVDHTKDEKVITILEEAGIRPKKKQKRPRISFIKTKTIN